MTDAQMIKQIAEALIVSEGIRLSLPDTPAFALSSKEEEDIREGLSARIAKMTDNPLSMLFLEHMNELNVLDDYLDDPESEASSEQQGHARPW